MSQRTQNHNFTRFIYPISPKPGPDSKTLEWLKLRHLIDKTPDSVLHNKLSEIIVILGGIKSHLKWLLSNSFSCYASYASYVDKAKLLSLIELIQENEPQNKNNCTENTENTLDSKNALKTTETKKIFNMVTLPQDIASYLTSFLTFREINALQITCSDIAYICLNEMKKSDIGLIHFDTLIGRENIIDLGRDNQLIHNYRMYDHDKLSQAFNKWINVYDIPRSKVLFHALRKLGNSHRPFPLHHLEVQTDIASLTHTNYIMFDLRTMYKIGGDNIAVSDSAKACIVLKYFDIEQQKLYIVGSALILHDSTLLDLMNFIMDKLVVDNIHLEYFQKLQIMLNRMSTCNGRKILLFQELSEFPHRCEELGGDDSTTQLQYIFQNVIPGDIIIFQVNPVHSYFSKSISKHIVSNSNYMTDNFDEFQMIPMMNNNVIQMDENKCHPLEDTTFDRNYHKMKNKYTYTAGLWQIEISDGVLEKQYGLEKQYESRGLNMFYLAPHFCRYRQQFRNIKVTYRHQDHWNNVLVSILRLNKSRNKIISSKYHDVSIHFEMNSNTSYGQIRKRIAFIYGIDYTHIEIWIPRSVIHDNVFEYASSFRGIHTDSIQSFFKSKSSNFILPIQWEITPYSTVKYDQIVATEMEKMQDQLIEENLEYMHQIHHDTQYEISRTLHPHLAIYRVILVPPDSNDTEDKKTVDVIYDAGFQVNLFISHVLCTIAKQPILCDEYRDIVNALCSNMDILKLTQHVNMINNELVLSTDDAERCLFGHDRFSFPVQNSVIDIERNTFVLQRMENEIKFNLRFVKCKEINEDESAIIFKFWKYINNQYEVCGMILRVKVAANDNLKNIIENKLKDTITEKCKFYLNAIKNSEYLGSLIEPKNYQYFYPFTILLQVHNACLNVLLVS